MASLPRHDGGGGAQLSPQGSTASTVASTASLAPSTASAPALGQDDAYDPGTSLSSMPDRGRLPSDRMHKRTAEKKGHRRVMADGSTTYKKAESSDIMAGIQFGLRHSIGGINPKERKDILMEDFEEIEVVDCPSEGSVYTPAHRHPDFTFKTYAPKVFRYFREAFGINPEDFLVSLCNERLKELSNPGASGSLFYLSPDDNFLIKTVQSREAVFLRKLLPGYFLNLTQNTKTLLPKFFGLYCYRTHMGRSIHFLIMNNILPSHITFDERYDLKGSTLGRVASAKEKAKKSPTYKDLDFVEMHAGGLRLEANTYQALMRTLERDCRVLASFKIMDYSLLLGVHYLDTESTRQLRLHSKTKAPSSYAFGLKDTLALDTTTDINFGGGIVGFVEDGRAVLVFLGIIDVLQQYKMRKIVEHNIKAMLHEADHISVHNPKFYSARFQRFCRQTVMRQLAGTEVHTLMAANPLFSPSIAKDSPALPPRLPASPLRSTSPGSRARRAVTHSHQPHSPSPLRKSHSLPEALPDLQGPPPSPQPWALQPASTLPCSPGPSCQGPGSEADPAAVDEGPQSPPHSPAPPKPTTEEPPPASAAAHVVA